MKELAGAAIRNDFLGKKKGKKLKKIELGKGKMKKAKVISEEQDILNILRSSGKEINRYEDLSVALAAKNKTIANSSKTDFYIKILQYNYNISKISISDILGGRKLNSILFMGDLTKFPMSCFSNDKLFWVTFACVKYEKFDEIKQYIDFSNLKMDIATLAIKFEKDYTEGYVQDFNKQFTFIGFNQFNTDASTALATLLEYKKENIEKICKTSVKQMVKKDFTYNNIQYKTIFINNDIGLVYKASYSEKDLKQIVEDTKIISSNEFKKAKTELEVKKAPTVGDRGGIYISQTVKLTDFTPIMVTLAESMNTEILFQYDIDVASLNEYLLKRHNNIKKTEKKNKVVGDFFAGIELDDKDIGIVYSMMLILYITEYKQEKIVDDNGFKSSLESFLEQYSQHREDLNKIRYMFDLSFSIIEKFYDAFKTKINFDPIKALYNTIIKVIVSIEDFYTKFDYTKLIYWFRDLSGLNKVFVKLEKAIENRNWIYNLIKKIHNVTQMINSLSEPREIMKNIRETGTYCYRIFYNPKEKDALGLVWKIRSPSSFLGNVFAELDAKFDIASIKAIDKAIEKYTISTEEEIKQINGILDVMASPDTKSEEDIKKIIFGLASILKDYGGIEPRYIYKNPEDKSELTDTFTKWAIEAIKGLSEEELKKIGLYYKAKTGSFPGLSMYSIFSTIKNLETLKASFNKFVEDNIKKRDSEISKIALEIAKLKDKKDEIKEIPAESEFFDEVDTETTRKYTTKESIINAIKDKTKYKINLEKQKALGLKIIENEKGLNKSMLQSLREAGLLDEVIMELMEISPKLEKKAIKIAQLSAAFKKNNEIIKQLAKEQKKLSESGVLIPEIPEILSL